MTMASTLPAPRLRHVFRLDAELAAPVDVGDTPQGHRRVVALTGGRAEGPQLTAELVAAAGAADWQLVRPSGTAVADLRYVLRTDAGALLYVRAQGLRHGPSDVLTRLAAGEEVDPATYTFRTTVTIETADEQLAWLNDGVFVAVGGRWPQGVSYDIYVIE
jgi:hypothetical protein